MDRPGAQVGLRTLPPDKLLPDRQPAYVASWIYVFGVASLAALAVAIASGFAIAVGGVDWWHVNPVGHFFNSPHLWSVELFMALIVIHLRGKFWMAAWRGRRGWTWVTGVVAFLASIVECFTGYLSQSNFDSQWISTSGKDAFNSVGAGAFFNLMNFGQMLLWHVVLIPVLLVAVAGAHVLLVRVRGVSHPIDDPGIKEQGRARRRALRRADAAPWHGPTRRYDILKEGTIATAVVLGLVFLLAGLLFNAAQDFVIQPLTAFAPGNRALAAALAVYRSAPPGQQLKWANAYANAVAKVKFAGGTPVVPAAADGPVPVMMAGELTMARSGALDTDLLAQRQFYGTNYTKPLLFIEDGSYFPLHRLVWRYWYRSARPAGTGREPRPADKSPAGTA